MTERAMFTAWISKYAMTTGVYAQRVIDCGDGMVREVKPDGDPGWGFFHGEGKEWHRTREGACERAEAMRENKIRSVKKQLAKLEAMSFIPQKSAPPILASHHASPSGERLLSSDAAVGGADTPSFIPQVSGADR